MKRALAMLVPAAVIALFAAGCKSDKVHVINNSCVVTNNVSMRAFNDETYVWESWTIGTNKV